MCNLDCFRGICARAESHSWSCLLDKYFLLLLALLLFPLFVGFFFFTFFPLQLGLNLECMIRERVSARVSVRSLGNEKPIELANHHCRRHRIWQANLSAIHILMKQTEIVCMLSAPHSWGFFSPASFIHLVFIFFCSFLSFVSITPNYRYIVGLLASNVSIVWDKATKQQRQQKASIDTENEQKSRSNTHTHTKYAK